MNVIRRSGFGVFLAVLLVMTGCERAPAFDILGSFFPAWRWCGRFWYIRA